MQQNFYAIYLWIHWLKMAHNPTRAMPTQNDLQAVRIGVPAYLSMTDSIIQRDADYTDWLLAGARWYCAC